MNLQAHAVAGAMGKEPGKPMSSQNAARRGINCPRWGRVLHRLDSSLLGFQHRGVEAPNAASRFTQKDRPCHIGGVTAEYSTEVEDYQLTILQCFRGRAGVRVGGAEPGGDLPTRAQALAQLGLKLELAKGPREFLVVDRVERPSEN